MFLSELFFHREDSMYEFEKTGIGKEFFFGSASVWDSRTFKFLGQIASFERCLSWGGSNAPRPALYVMYLASNAYGG